MDLFYNKPIFDEPLAPELYDFYGIPAELSAGSTADLSIPSQPRGGLNDPDRPAILVRCGPPSGLYAIIFAKQEAAIEFLAANPVAATTMTTLSLADGVIFWFRFQSERIARVETPSIALCSGGLVPFAWQGEDLDNRFIRFGPIAEVDWSALKWDAGFEKQLKIARLETTLGPMFVKLGPRRTGLNDAIICRGFADEKNLIFDPEADKFFTRTPTQELEVMSENVLLEQLTVWLQRLAENLTGFPQREMRLVRLKSLIQYLKLLTAVSRPSFCDHIRSYLSNHLLIEPGRDVTMDEIQVHFSRCAKENNIGPYSSCKLSRELSRLIRTMFGVLPSHDIRRWNDKDQKSTNRRGFRKITFRSSDSSEASESFEKIKPSIL